jgi:Lysozyme like domain
MTVLTFGQIEQLWIKNGGDPSWAPTMAGVALAESGGNVENLNNNPSTGDYSVGLWQINYFGGLAPSRTASFGPPAQLQQDANAQAKAAVSILGGGPGITAWKGDKVGNAAQNGQPLSLAAVEALVSQFGLGSTADATNPTPLPTDLSSSSSGAVGGSLPVIGGALTAASATDSFFSDITNPNTLKRVGVFSLGAALFIAGLGLFLSTTKTADGIKEVLD